MKYRENSTRGLNDRLKVIQSAERSKRDNREENYFPCNKDAQPAMICVPRLFDCGTVFGYQILVRGSKGYY